jgi:hypothetical protein
VTHYTYTYDVHHITVKNFAKGTEPAKKAKAAPSAKAAKVTRNENAGDPDGFDVKVLALPLCFASVLGLYFALAAVDPGFVEFMEVMIDCHPQCLIPVCTV